MRRLACGAPRPFASVLDADHDGDPYLLYAVSVVDSSPSRVSAQLSGRSLPSVEECPPLSSARRNDRRWRSGDGQGRSPLLVAFMPGTDLAARASNPISDPTHPASHDQSVVVEGDEVVTGLCDGDGRVATELDVQRGESDAAAFEFRKRRGRFFARGCGRRSFARVDGSGRRGPRGSTEERCARFDCTAARGRFSGREEHRLHAASWDSL